VSDRSLGARFSRLWVGVAVSNLGDGLRVVAFPLLAATITRDPAQVAGLTVALRVPWLLFSIPAGGLIDRVDRRRLMAAASLFRAAAMGLLGIVMFWESVSLPFLYAVAFLVGLGEVVFDTTAQVMIPATVDRQHLERANGRIYATELLGNEFAGPLIGSFLFGLAMGVPFVTCAGAYVIATLVILTLTGDYRVAGGDAGEVSTRRRALDGLRYVWRDRLLRSLTLFGAVWNFIVGGITAVLVLFALEVLGTGEVGFGLLIAAEAIGGIIGTFLAPRLSSRFGPGTLILSAAILQGVGYSITGLLSNPWWAGVTLAIAQAGAVACIVVLVSLRQAIVPNQLLGRVTAAMRVVAIGAMPLGAAVGGVSASFLGLRAPLALAAPVFILMVLISSPVINNRTIANARHDSS
jgi:MFS family permease